MGRKGTAGSSKSSVPVADTTSAREGGGREVLTIENVPIRSVMEDPANVRTHGEDNIESIKASLRRFGQQKPLVVDRNNVVRVGNGTLVAARSLGWATVDVVRTNLEGVEATAYAIADNRTAELAAWDRAALLAALKSLQYEPVFGSGAVGFTDEDLNEMLRASVDAGTGTSYKDVDGKEYDESVVNEVKYLVCPQCGIKFPK